MKNIKVFFYFADINIINRDIGVQYMYQNNDENDLMEELQDVIEQAKLMEIQFDEYCRAMKEMMLAGSTNN